MAKEFDELAKEIEERLTKGRGSCRSEKRRPQLLRQLTLKHLRLNAKETIMIGDNPTSDIQSAHNLGMYTVRLMCGPNRTQPDTVAADFKIKNLSKLVNIVCPSVGSRVSK